MHWKFKILLVNTKYQVVDIAQNKFDFKESPSSLIWNSWGSTRLNYSGAKSMSMIKAERSQREICSCLMMTLPLHSQVLQSINFKYWHVSQKKSQSQSCQSYSQKTEIKYRINKITCIKTLQKWNQNHFLSPLLCIGVNKRASALASNSAKLLGVLLDGDLN